MYKRVVVFGGGGFIGRNFLGKSTIVGACEIFHPDSRALDLVSASDLTTFLTSIRPDLVISFAARVGNSFTNRAESSSFAATNLHIQLSLMEALRQSGCPPYVGVASMKPVSRLSWFGGVRESAGLDRAMKLLDGYSLSKLVEGQLIPGCYAEMNAPCCTVYPCNVYGPHDRFELSRAQIVPSAILKCDSVARGVSHEVVAHGSADDQVELLYIDDLIAALDKVISCLGKVPMHLEVGSGELERVGEVFRLVGAAFELNSGLIRFNCDSPSIAPVASSGRIREMLNWAPEINLVEGVSRSIDYYLSRFP